MFDLTGKIAFVSGGLGDIGKSIAEALADVNAKVIITDIISKNKVNLNENLNKKIYNYHTLDITNLEMIKNVVAQYKKIDILVNCAGINRRGHFFDLSEKDWDDVLTINLKGTFLLSKIIGEKMVENEFGRIINIGSLSSYIGLPNMMPYVASKGGITQMTKAMAMELAPNVNVNAIAPGYFETNLTKKLFENKEWKGKTLARIPLQRTGCPEDLKGIAVFLSSPASNYVTGQTIYVDGGWISS